MPNRPPQTQQPEDDDSGKTHLRADLKVTREIPMWGILSVVAALGAQAVSLYYGQQTLLEKVTALTVEVKELRVAAQRYELDRERVTTVQADILRRLAEVERRMNVIQLQKGTP